MASRNHAELAWDAGKVYITDCNSLNGILLNGRRIRNTDLVEPGDQLEIGSHRFFFVRLEQPVTPQELDDPLARHVWHSTVDLQSDNEKIPMTEPLNGEARPSQPPVTISSTTPASTFDEATSIESQDTAELEPVVDTPQPG